MIEREMLALACVRSRVRVRYLLPPPSCRPRETEGWELVVFGRQNSGAAAATSSGALLSCGRNVLRMVSERSTASPTTLEYRSAPSLPSSWGRGGVGLSNVASDGAGEVK